MVAEHVGDLDLGHAEHPHLDQLLEDDPVGDAWVVAAQRVGVDDRWDQRGELVPDGLNEPRWDGGHGASWIAGFFSQITLVTGAVPVPLLRHAVTYPRDLLDPVQV